MNVFALGWLIGTTLLFVLVLIWLYRQISKRNPMELSVAACACHVKDTKALHGTPRVVSGGIGLIWMAVSVLPALALTQGSASSFEVPGGWANPAFWVVLAVFGYLFYLTGFQFLIFLLRGHSVKCAGRRLLLGFMFS